MVFTDHAFNNVASDNLRTVVREAGPVGEQPLMIDTERFRRDKKAAASATAFCIDVNNDQTFPVEMALELYLLVAKIIERG